MLIALIFTGRYFETFISCSQGTSIAGKISRNKSVKDLLYGAPSNKPIKDTLGSAKAAQSRASLPFGNKISRIAGEFECAREAVAINCGRCERRIGGWDVPSTKMAEKCASTKGSCLLSGGASGSIAKPSLPSELSPSEMSVASRPCTAFGFTLLDKVSRLRVMAFNPITINDAIPGGGGTASTKVCLPSLASCLFRFLSLLPFDLAMWLARCCPIGDSVLSKVVKLSGSSFVMHKL